MTNIETRLTDVSPHEQSLVPSLFIEVEITLVSGNRSKIIDGIASLSVISGSGPQYVGSGPIIDFPELRPNQSSNATFLIELDDEILERVEQVRSDDLPVRASGKFHSVPQGGSPSRKIVEYKCQQSIPRSEWAKTLDKMGFANVEVFEVKFPKELRQTYFSDAWQHLENAEEAFSMGDWQKTLAACRDAISEVQKLNNTENMEDYIDDEKWENRLESAIGQLHHFLSIGDHGEIMNSPYKRRDAHLGLIMSKSVVAFIADAMREAE